MSLSCGEFHISLIPEEGGLSMLHVLKLLGGFIVIKNHPLIGLVISLKTIFIPTRLKIVTPSIKGNIISFTFEGL